MKDIINCTKCSQAIIKYGSTKCGSVNETYNNLFKHKGIEAATVCPGFKRVVIGDYSDITLDRALRFMLAGNAEFKLISGKTGREIYYKIVKRATYDSSKGNEFIYWVNAGNNAESKQFIGTVYFNNQKSQFEFSRGNLGVGYSDSIEVKSILYVLNKLYSGKYSINLRVCNGGTCGVCNRQLTSIKEILNGIEIGCMKKIKTPDIDIGLIKRYDT